MPRTPRKPSLAQLRREVLRLARQSGDTGETDIEHEAKALAALRAYERALKQARDKEQ